MPVSICSCFRDCVPRATGGTIKRDAIRNRGPQWKTFVTGRRRLGKHPENCSPFLGQKQPRLQMALLFNGRIQSNRGQFSAAFSKAKKPARTHARAGELGSTNTDKSTRNRWSGDEAHHEPDTDRLIPTDLAAYTICRAKPIDFMLEDMLIHV